MRLQTGYVYHYAFAMLIGVVALVTWYFLCRVGLSPMSDLPLLSLVTFLPLVGRRSSSASAASPRSWPQTPRVALWTSLVTFVLSLFVWTGFDPTQAGFQFVEKAAWLPGLGIQYHMGVDGISLLVRAARTLLTLDRRHRLLALGRHRVKEYMIAFLVMDTLMVGVFCSLDILLFYVFFEGILIPMYLIIGIWGGPRRIYAAFKFFLYTLLGSVLFLVAILVIYLKTGTTDIPPRRGRPRTRSASAQDCSGSPCSSRSPSRCRCGRSTPGCPTRTSRRPRPARCCWRASS